MTTATLERPADCVAPRTGLTGYKIHGCRCAGCTRESTAYNNRRDRLIAYGRWQHMVDAEPVRQHIRNLMAADIGWQRVAQAAGVSTGGVSRILYGGGGRPPCKRVKKATADAILAVKPSPELRSVDSTIDATGTRRRTQALVALGWSLTEQATRLGRTIQNHKYVLTTDRVTIRTAKLVAELYDELSTRTPPPGVSATRSKRWAQRNGWVPPLAWDDDAIDDPNAQPELGEPADDDSHDETTVGLAIDGRLTYRQLAGHRPDLIETVRRLAKRMTDAEIALHLHWPNGHSGVCQIRKRHDIPTCSTREVIAPTRTRTRDRVRAERRRTAELAA